MTFREALLASPGILPIAFDPVQDLVQLVEWSESEFKQFSFHDGRSLIPGHRRTAIRWSELRSLAIQLPRRCHYIFHISHCGSTLLSRLLGRLPLFLCLREPGAMRALIGEETKEVVGFLGLYSRTYHPQQTAVIKLTSFLNCIGQDLMDTAPDSQAVLMHVPFATFLPALLGGAYSDIESLATNRCSRLRKLLDCNIPEPISRGEWVALSWLTEMLSLARLWEQWPKRCLGIDFERFLRSPDEHLAGIASHFGVALTAQDMQCSLQSHDLNRYAKNPSQAYDANDRKQILDRSAAEWSSEIVRGSAWLSNVLLLKPGLEERLLAFQAASLGSH